MFRIVDPRADRGRVDDLSRQLAQARDERPRLAARLESARALLADLTEQTRAFGAARIRQLEARRDELTADAAAAHARTLDANATLERANRLTAQGAGTTVQANLAKRDADVAAQNEIAAQGLIAVNDVELDIRPPRRVRRRQLQRSPDFGAARRRPRQQIVDFEQALDESDRRIARLSQDVADEQARYAELSSAAIVAPAKGSIWEVLTAPGEQVRRGQELARVLDCGGALVTATVGESVYDRLRVGSPARFQPRDGGGDLAGTVISLTGSSTTPANFAIEPAALARGAYHVTVSVPGLAGGADLRRRPHRPGDVRRRSRRPARRPAAQPLVSPFLASAVECCWPAAVVAGAGFAALPWLKRDNTIARAVVVAIVLALMWRYMLWRWFSTLPPFGFTLDTLARCVFIFVETAALVGATISFFFLPACATAPPRSKPTWAG